MASSLLQGKPFFCREWAFLKLAHCLEQRGGGTGGASSAGAVILGGPGSGKTALCCELVWPTNLPQASGDPPPPSSPSSPPQAPLAPHAGGASRQRASLRRRLLAYHFCQAHDAESLAPAPFVRRLAEQLSDCPLLPGFGEKLMRDPEAAAALRPGACERDPDQALQRAVLFPLLELDPPPHRPCLMLVDAVDESHAAAERAISGSGSQSSSGTGSRSIAELLSAHHHLLPRWLLLVVTARRQSRTVVSRLFAGFRRLALDDLRRAAVVRDVQGYILARLDREEALRAHVTRDTAEMLNQLHIKSAGCVLYLERVLDGVADGFVGLREVREIPGTLNGLYLWLCQRLFNRKQFARVQPLLCVILAAREPLTTEMLFRAVWTSNSSLTREDLARRLTLLRRVLAPSSITGEGTVLPSGLGTKKSGRAQFPPNQIILLFHPSFAEWLLDVKHCTRKYLCSAADGNAMLAAALWLRGSKLTASETRALTLHLSASPLKPPMQHWHLAAWLAESGAPLDECLEKAPPSPHRDPRALRLLLDAGAKRKTTAADGEDAMQRSTIQVEQIACNGSDPISSSPKASEPGSPCGEGEEGATETAENIEPEEDPLADLLAAEEAALAAEAAATENGNLGTATLGSGRTALHSLAAEGDERRVRLLLSRQGAGAAAVLTAADRHGQTPLGLAARHGHAGVVRALLEAAGDTASTAVDSADADGWTPLRSAAWGGHAAVVEALLEAGAKVDGADAEGRTALRAAAWGGHEEVVLGLLRAGADPGGADREGRTPLIAAAYMGHAEIVSHLLDFGAPVDHEDADGRTALSVAALCVPANEGYAKVVSILLERGAAVDHEDREGMTALLVAAFEGHRDVCELLLEYEADVDHSDGAGRTPLWAAASMGHTAVVELLLFWGCGVDGIDAEGRTVLGVAAAQGCSDVVRRLLDRGLDETHRDNAGWTPLHYAAFEGHRDAAEALIDAGARLDDTDNEGKAPLALAAQEGHLHVVRLLLDRGAPVDARAHDGKTALRAAALEGRREVMRLLLSHGADADCRDADGRSTLYALALEGRTGAGRVLLSEGAADVETRDREGRTPLHVAAWQGHVAMVELLLAAGAKVNAEDHEARTALHGASWQGHASVVRLLLGAGASVDHSCTQGATPLCIAAQEGHAECVRVLLRGGADPNHADHCGRTALRVAAKSGHDEVVRILEDFAATAGSPAVSAAGTPLPRHKAQNGQGGAFPTGGSSSTTSMTSGSTAETKPSSAVLCQPQVPPFSQTAQVGSALLPPSGPPLPPHQHSYYHQGQHQLPPPPLPHHGASSHLHSSPPPHPQPLDSPESSVDKRRSVASLGNRSSGGLSSSNCTGSTKSSQRSSSEPHGVAQPLPPPLLPPSGHSVNCASHQCHPQQAHAGQPHHNPQHHLYQQLSFTQQLQQCTRAAKSRPQGIKTGVPPPPGALSPLSEPQSPIYASPPPSPLSDAPSGRRSPAVMMDTPTSATSNGAVPHVGLHPIPGVTDCVSISQTPISFNRDAHMKIILGGGRPDPSNSSSTPAASKLKRNGIVTNPNVKVSGGGVGGLAGFRLGLKNGLEARRRQAGARANGFPWKKETPL
ncbi:ankyrin repeat domain-containing protein 50 isoform X1 [Ischnura elegans]|uniref:ankyrin repeat domain-containing protein 50 isoform X1 n=1 Tax=Ischnura elegans TaxID=197161 RepID=UPI001ED86744|nr:ankyrin repeat domain-containing protein 50 isoform X1 [Ischnura elegans]XP_046383300.1 ankyrin repeat domain-containing protein 50 isoform X1 [Ischnura elegans]